MNYTKPQDPNYEDSPQDWLNSALIFTRALSLILKETEGVLVNIAGDVDLEDKTIKQVIVYKENDQIHILPYEGETELAEGTMVWMTEFSEN